MTSAQHLTTGQLLDRLRDPAGRFSMLAIDQRESLRQMLTPEGAATPATDADLVAFKTLVVRTLSPYTSAVLVDRQYGAPAAAVSEAPLILAADLLAASVPGGPVDTAALDEEITPEVVADLGASALKMLVPWRPDERDAAIDLSARFMDLCRRAGLPGVVEGVIRPADIATWSDEDRDAALVEAARDLGATEPDLYKTEVPSYGAAEPEILTTAARAITGSIACPWVVLSSGVKVEHFAAAVRACGAGGAAGFLAGRAVWADATRAEDPSSFLRTESVRRLQELSDAEAAR